MEIDEEELDVLAVGDVSDVGNGRPLFANFAYEDWTLLSLRYELHLLVHSFRKDLNDADRQSFSEEHLPFYYNKYFKKQLNLKSFGASTTVEVLNFIQDTVDTLSKNSMLDPQLTEETPIDNFVRLTEDMRRERQLRIDSGDEKGVLNFTNVQSSSRPWSGSDNHSRGTGGKGDRRGDQGRHGGQNSKYDDRSKGNDRSKGDGRSGGYSSARGSGGGGGGRDDKYNNSSSQGQQKRSFQPSSGGGSGGSGYGGSSQPPYKQSRSGYSGSGGGSGGAGGSRGGGASGGQSNSRGGGGSYSGGGSRGGGSYGGNSKASYGAGVGNGYSKR